MHLIEMLFVECVRLRFAIQVLKNILTI